MAKFRVASRTSDELTAHKAELDAMFDKIKGEQRGKINKAGLKELHEGRYEIAELIVQLITDEVALTDPTPFLVETVDGDIRDSYIWRELHPDSAIRVVNRAYGSKPLSQRLFFKEFGMSTAHKEVAVHVPLEEIASGSVTASLVASEIAQSIVRHRAAMVFNAIDDGVPSGNDQTGVSGYTLRYTTLDQTKMDKAIDGLQDDNLNPVVLGRHIYLAPKIRAFTTFSDETLAEFDTRGMIGTYHGAKIVTLQDDYSRRNDGHVFPADTAIVAGQRLGAIYMAKDVSFLNYSLIDERTATFETGLRLEEGVMVWNPYRYRVITG